jgi:hypothetical protein
VLVWVGGGVCRLRACGAAGGGGRDGRGLSGVGEWERGAAWGRRGVSEFAPDLVGFAGEAGALAGARRGDEGG